MRVAGNCLFFGLENEILCTKTGNHPQRRKWECDCIGFEQDSHGDNLCTRRVRGLKDLKNSKNFENVFSQVSKSSQ